MFATHQLLLLISDKTNSVFSSFPVFCSRIGLDWACTVADILHSLNACPEWSTVIAAFTDHCIQQLPQTLKRTNLFTLLVLVGFPEVGSIHIAV